MAEGDRQTAVVAQGEAVLGRYRLIAELGRGGMASVFLAVAQGPASFNKLVVIKRHHELIGDDQKVVTMFLDEAKLSARLSHPNIIQIYEIGEENGAYFIVMEYLEGQPLNRILRAVTDDAEGAAAFSRGACVRIIADVLSGLHYAHELADYDGTPLGIVHRDVSPHNIFVTYDGTVKLVDFGIAKAVTNSQRTDTGDLKGKTSYMAPEQARQSRVVDRRADIFATGIVLWELLTRERLFGFDIVHALQALVADDEIPRPSSVAPDIPPALDNIVAKALERDPAKRFATAQEMRTALEDYLRTSGDNVPVEELARSMQRVFSQRRASIRRQIKECLDRVTSRPSVVGLPRFGSSSVLEGGHEPQSVRLPSIDDSARTTLHTPGQRSNESASLKATMVPATSSRRGYLLGGLGVAALLAGAALTARVIGGRAPMPPAPGGSERRQCEGTIRVRITTDNTGTATDIAPPYNHGVYDYLRFLNEKQGGIRGCPIDVDMQDARYDPTDTEAVINAWRQSPAWAEVSTVFVFGTGPATHVASKLMEERKLIIPGSYAGSLATPAPVSANVSYPELNAAGQSITKTVLKTSPGYPYVFFPATDYSTGIRIGIQAAWKIAPGRLAMVHDFADRCLYCVDPLVAGKSYIQKLPGMLLAEDLIVPQTSNLADGQTIVKKVVGYMQKEIIKKKADASYVPVSWFWAGNSVVSTSFVAKGAAEAQQMINRAFPVSKSQWQLRVMANNWGIGETSAKICGPSCAGILYGLFPVPVYGDTHNAIGMKQMIEIHDMYRAQDNEPRDRYADVRYVQGYAAALMWRRAIERAIDAGHKNPTGEDLKNALESFHNVVLDGMTAGSISFTPKDHRPQANESVYKLDMVGAQTAFTFVDQYSIELDPAWLGY